jgi:hypothetical protein
MPEHNAPELVAIGMGSYDDTYLAWRKAALEAQQALRDWFDASAGDRVLRFFAYRAALDREEAAARELQRVTELAQPRVDAVDDRPADLTSVGTDSGPAIESRPTAESQTILNH